MSICFRHLPTHAGLNVINTTFRQYLPAALWALGFVKLGKLISIVLSNPSAILAVRQWMRALRSARNAAIHDRASASVSSVLPLFLQIGDDSMGAENTDVEVPKPRRKTRVNYSIVICSTVNLTSQGESIRAMSGSCGTWLCESYKRNVGPTVNVFRRISDPFFTLISFELFGYAFFNGWLFSSKNFAKYKKFVYGFMFFKIRFFNN